MRHGPLCRGFSAEAFNYSSGVIFTPGAQRAPADPKLFGTGPTGSTVNPVATLGLFDGESIAGPAPTVSSASATAARSAST